MNKVKNNKQLVQKWYQQRKGALIRTSFEELNHMLTEVKSSNLKPSRKKMSWSHTLCEASTAHDWCETQTVCEEKIDSIWSKTHWHCKELLWRKHFI